MWTTHEYGSQFLSLGGVHHLTAGSKREGRVTCDMMMALGNKQSVELDIEGGAQLIVQSNQAPVVNGLPEKRMRVGCGSATIGIFAQQWFGLVDEVIVVDDHITGVMSEHQAGRCLNWKETGLRLKGKRFNTGPILSGGRAWQWLGRHQHCRSPVHHRKLGPGQNCARSNAADGFDHGR